MFFIFEYKNVKFDEQYFENEPFVFSKENTIILKIILSATIIIMHVFHIYCNALIYTKKRCQN